MKILWCIGLLFISCHALAQEVFIKDGNVYLKTAQAEVVQMTTSGNDADPVLSPDKDFIAFVRDTPGSTVSTGSGDENATELWLLNIATRNAELLTRGKENPKMEQTIAAMRSPLFSLDGSSVYFVSAAWATSPSVQKVSRETKRVQFVSDGGLEGIVKKGEYRGFVLVARALIKFDRKGMSLGRNIYLWLVSPDGKPIREIGRDDSAAAEDFRKNALAE